MVALAPRLQRVAGLQVRARRGIHDPTVMLMGGVPSLGDLTGLFNYAASAATWGERATGACRCACRCPLTNGPHRSQGTEHPLAGA